MADNQEIEVKKEVEENSKIKKLLDKCPKRKIRIPADPLNEKNKFVEVAINGYFYKIEREKEVSVPEPVYDILVRAKYI